MRKILFVGCGGTGGAVLTYLMDQLKSDLARYGVTDLPGGWEFLQVDVPQQPESVLGLGTIVDQGGRYVSCAPASPTYELVDAGVSQQLRGAGGLGAVGTWVPDPPQSVTVPIQAGAGQYRAVGRVLTLSKVSQIRSELEAAWGRLSTVEATASMNAVVRAMPSLGRFATTDPPVIIVVSSMAGGSGASMALDVCRLLTLVPGVDPSLVAVFMASADVFESLPESTRQGVRPNALAMFGEIVASQAHAASEDDAFVLSRLGLTASSFAGAPFARVFPIGRSVGLAGQAVQFGDGSMSTVYRGVGRGLAALVSSASALQGFVAYDLGNPQPVPTRRELFAWGLSPENVQWGAFGFGSLSMGRDRYAEYAAQRVARSCTDHLLEGHLHRGISGASGPDQAGALVDSQWRTACARVGLPSGKVPDQQGEMRAFVNASLSNDQVNRLALAAVDTQLAHRLPTFAGGTPADQIVATVQSALTQSRGGLREAVAKAAYDHLYEWAGDLVQRLEWTVEESVATHGLPYARTLLERLRTHLDSYVAVALEALGRGHNDPASVPSTVQAFLASLRGNVAQSQTVVDEVVKGYVRQSATQIKREWCALASPVLRSMLTGVIDPLVKITSDSMALLETARADETLSHGVARIETDFYRMWPSDTDQSVAERWAEATNEVLITPSAAFMTQYDHDLPLSLGGEQSSDEQEDRREVIRRVVAGVWPTDGEQPPGGLLTRLSTWRTRELPTDPSGNPTVPQVAAYDLAVRPKQVLARARAYIGRPHASFHDYTMMSLREYAAAGDIPEAGRTARRADLIEKFRQTLAMALPLVSVDNTAVQNLHASRDVSFRYKFSAVPFRDLHELETGFARVLTDDSRIHTDSGDNLGQSFDGSDVTRLDVFGSYQNFSPLVFDGLLRPIIRQWNSSDASARQQFWRQRRTRRLAAALPLGPAERRSMVAGWFLGQIVGAVTIPTSPYDKPVAIWDATSSQWLAFPHPLLTPPDRFKAPYDWLPAVLESSLLAFARFGDHPVGSSLRPYQALRRLYDASADEPANPIAGMFRLAGDELVSEWLRTGQTPPGGTSRVPGLSASSTVSDRQGASAQFLAQIEKVARAQSEAVQSVTDRKAVGALPMFSDIADDVMWATEVLGRMVHTSPEEAADHVF